jgi:hypothetical protein
VALDVARVESALAVSDPGDLVVNTRTGEVYPVTVAVVPSAALRFGPGIPIPVQWGPYVQAVLDAIGWEVDGLTWEWPKA